MLLIDGDVARSPRNPEGVQRRREDTDIDLDWLEPRSHGRLDHLPAALDVAAEHPGLESLLPDGYSRMTSRAGATTTFRRRRRSLEIGRIHQPRAADLAGWQDAQPDASVDRHVVDPKEIRRLAQAETTGCVRGDQPASVPANTCHASADFATRLHTK